MKLPMVRIDSYNLEVRDEQGFVGDQASQTAFRKLLDDWRKRRRARGKKDPLGDTPSADLTKKTLDASLKKKIASEATDVVHGAIEEFAEELVQVIKRFLRQRAWRDVERIVIGGGFPESDVGERAILQAAALFHAEDQPVELARLCHDVDDGGLLGWLHLAPPRLLERYDAIVALDLGGTNARCGIVKPRLNKAADFSRAKVVRRTKWRHADENPSRAALVKGLAGMVADTVRYARRKGIALAPFVGIACPGLIRDDGAIARGAQNLPGNWEDERFHLPTALARRLPAIDGKPVQVVMHNDAVVQGLSELPFMQDVRRWAVLTIGTGLGNACYVNRKRRVAKPKPKRPR